jgi:hypothetical protein
VIFIPSFPLFKGRHVLSRFGGFRSDMTALSPPILKGMLAHSSLWHEQIRMELMTKNTMAHL